MNHHTFNMLIASTQIIEAEIRQVPPSYPRLENSTLAVLQLNLTAHYKLTFVFTVLCRIMMLPHK